MPNDNDSIKVLSYCLDCFLKKYKDKRIITNEMLYDMKIILILIEDILNNNENDQKDEESYEVKIK